MVAAWLVVEARQIFSPRESVDITIRRTPLEGHVPPIVTLSGVVLTHTLKQSTSVTRQVLTRILPDGYLGLFGYFFPGGSSTFVLAL